MSSPQQRASAGKSLGVSSMVMPGVKISRLASVNCRASHGRVDCDYAFQSAIGIIKEVQVPILGWLWFHNKPPPYIDILHTVFFESIRFPNDLTLVSR